MHFVKKDDTGILVRIHLENQTNVQKVTHRHPQDPMIWMHTQTHIALIDQTQPLNHTLASRDYREWLYCERVVCGGFVVIVALVLLNINF